MSMQFEQPMDEETEKRVKQMFAGNIAVIDEQNVLLEKLTEIQQKEMSKLAKTAKQPVTVNIHDQGDIVKMSDGTEYQVTKQGWQKV